MVLERLAFLDDRPVHEAERLGIEAFKKGGQEAEQKVKDDFAKKLNVWQSESCARGKKIFDEAKIERKKQFKRMMGEIKEKRSKLPDERKDLKTLYKTVDPDSLKGKEIYR